MKKEVSFSFLKVSLFHKEKVPSKCRARQVTDASYVPEVLVFSLSLRQLFMQQVTILTARPTPRPQTISSFADSLLRCG